MRLPRTRVAILVEDLYQDLEVWYPYYRLKEAGVEAVFVGTGKSEYTGKYGYPLTPAVAAEHVRAHEFDGVIIPGGYAPDLLRRAAAVIRLVREANRQGKLIGAICHAGWVLCSAGILRGKTATCFSAIKDDVMNAGATYVDREVVRDGTLITSRTPDDLPAFMRAFLDALRQSRAERSEVGGRRSRATGGRAPFPPASRVRGRRSVKASHGRRRTASLSARR